MGLKSKRKCRPKAAYKPGPEKQIQNAIQDLLLAHRILHFRMNTGFLQSKAGNWVRFGSVGMADLLVLPQIVRGGGVKYPHPLWIEVKSGKGQQTPDQVSFQKIVESEGHWYVVLRSIDEAIAYLKEKGL